MLLRSICVWFACFSTGCRTATEPEDTGEVPKDSGLPLETGLPVQWDCDQRFWTSGEPLILNTETETSQFCEQYNAVEGDLRVELGTDEDPIMTLGGLSCLCEVTGSIEIFYLGVASGTAGPPPPHISADLELDNLRRVGGDFYVHHVPGITTVEGVYQLEEVGGDLVLESNQAVGTVVFDSLTTVGGRFSMIGMGQLQALSSPRLVQAGALEIGTGDTWHSRFVYLGVRALEEVGGDFSVIGVPKLGELEAESLRGVGGALRLGSTCDAELSLPLLASAGSLHLVGQCGLASLNGLSSLTHLSGSEEPYLLDLSFNDGLDSQELSDFQAGFSLEEDQVLIQGVDVGGCDVWLQNRWGRTETDTCE